MKTLYLFVLCAHSFLPQEVKKSSDVDLNVLVGEWKLDLSPHIADDANFATMKITQVKDNSFVGEFYREGVKIRNSHINTQLGIIYAALISGDGSGAYHSTFYYDNGKLHGTTHAIDREFLAVWVATKMK